MDDLKARLLRKSYYRTEWHEPHGEIDVPVNPDMSEWDGVQETAVNPDGLAAVERIEALEAKNARLRDALEKVVGACRNARMVPKPGCGAGGMTIEANVRASVYNGVNAWSIEEAQEILDMSAWPAKH